MRAKKSLGQHWLVDGNILRRIAKAADFTEEDTVIEVGPGRGALTERLAPRAARLIAVELDRELAPRLAERYRDATNVAVLERDVLGTPVEEILNEGGGGLPYVVVGNLPYNVGSAIVRNFLNAVAKPRWLLVMLQAEVAERMAARPGGMSYLAVETQLFAEARVLFRVAPKAFRPPPKVDSAVLRLDMRDSLEVEVDDCDAFLELVRAGFAAPRKRLRNSLAVGLRVSAPEAGEILRAAAVDADQRPQMLDLEDWRRLYFGWRASAGEGNQSYVRHSGKRYGG
jgi:16S rRNA (adenine1518-N6/adenine1519-N6)-dimethyltransferase